jgi:hypothetical protein
VEKKRRAKDGLALKTRTQADYLAMLEPGRTSRGGKTFADGELYPLADKILSKITADDIRGVYTSQLERSQRQAVYAMQVVRAVLRWHGVIIPNNPLGRDRIVLASSKGKPAPIPPERLGAWWRTASVAPSVVAADYYRFQLLTACRGGEIHGSKQYDYPPIKVGDVDCKGGKIVLRDTKNRSDHNVQASLGDRRAQLRGQGARRTLVSARRCEEDAGLDQRAGRNRSAGAWAARHVRQHCGRIRVRRRSEADDEPRWRRRRDARSLCWEERSAALGSCPHS